MTHFLRHQQFVPVDNPVLLAVSALSEIAGQWALDVLALCDSDVDLLTLDAWARHRNVGIATLNERCRLLDIKPEGALNCARLLRAFRRASFTGQPVEEFLGGGRRILQTFLSHCGAPMPSAKSDLVTYFLRNQRFVPHDDPGFQDLLACLRRHKFSS